MRKLAYSVFVIFLAAFAAYAQQTSMSVGSGGAATLAAATTCTNQFISAISTAGAGTCTTATLASAQFANQGTATTVLHGNAAGNPSFAAVNLTNDVTGALATGQTKTAGTGAATAVIDGTLNLNVTPVVTTDAAEDVLMQYTLPQNTLSANGKGIRIHATFINSNNATANTYKLYFGATIIAQCGTNSTALNACDMFAIVVRTAAATQISASTTLLGPNTAGTAALVSTALYTTPAEDTTSAGGILIKGTGQKTAPGTITQVLLLTESLN